MFHFNKSPAQLDTSLNELNDANKKDRSLYGTELINDLRLPDIKQNQKSTPDTIRTFNDNPFTPSTRISSTMTQSDVFVARRVQKRTKQLKPLEVLTVYIKNTIEY